MQLTKPAKLRRAAISTAKFLNRMTTRPTPFGLFAAAAEAKCVPSKELVAPEFGADLISIHVDFRWLLSFVRRLESDPAILDDFWESSDGVVRLRGAYFLTHFVFYLTHFGRRHHGLESKILEGLGSILARLRLAAIQMGNNDLRLECESALVLLGLPQATNSLAELSCRLESNGCILPMENTPAFPQVEAFRVSYHTIIAFTILAALLNDPQSPSELDAASFIG
ncbi:lantibiotic dehydratase [Auritidibacter ignavus]|uniref:DUF6895 family protein n=1 Tax=Auritidibacter ignavus TaxID=678932 RepID=UPI002448AC8B|nr:lantibiotic dehydratase [Auritidibacter ignavus]WGH89993.1 lantibiotic dehydratase [Auritidibacter ignavus]WHS27047.1 lantibiotic dehydratase [Auritidibacter ignavus]